MEKWPVRGKENPGSQWRKFLKREGLLILLKIADMPSKGKQTLTVGFCNLEIVVTLDQHTGEYRSLTGRG